MVQSSARLGSLQGIDIGLPLQAAAAPDMGHFLSRVEVAALASGVRKVFVVDNWVNEERRRIKLAPMKEEALPPAAKGQVSSGGPRGAL